VPNYFFHVLGRHRILDRNGTDLADASEAKAQAVEVISDLLKEQDASFWNGPGCAMRIMDAEGTLIGRLWFLAESPSPSRTRRSAQL
jgi:hypothetical protein